MSKIGDPLTASATNTVNLTYLPQYLTFTEETLPTSIKVTIQGQPAPIVDLDSDGIATIGKAFMDGNVTNGYRIPMADGFIGNKNVVITVVCPALCTPQLYGNSPDGFGSQYFILGQQKTFASSPYEISGDEFDFISFENGTAASDLLNLTYEDGFTDTSLTLTELPFIVGAEYLVTNGDEDYYLDNIEDEIVSLTYIPNADTILYTGVFVDAGTQPRAQ